MCRDCLASGADEDVTGVAVVARNVVSMTDGADHSRFSHPGIFAPRLEPAVSISA